MTNLINHIANKDYESANKALEENFKVILEGKLHEMKKMCAAAMEQNTHDERQKRLRMDVIEQDEPPATGGFRPLNAPKSDDQEISRSMQNLNKDIQNRQNTQQNIDTERQQQRLKSGYSKLAEEDDIDEGLLDIAKKKLTKLRSPMSRANASERPVMRNIAGRPIGKKLKITPKNLEEDDSLKRINDIAQELKNMSKEKPTKLPHVDDLPDNLQQFSTKNIKEELMNEARVGVVKLRVRGGKVERRKKVSNVPGMTLRGGKLTRMSPAERRRRKLGAVKAARKTKAKKAQIMRKRKISLQKRARLGG